MRYTTVMSVLTLIVIFTLTITLSSAGYGYQKPKAVRLHDVTSLTFSKSDMTTSRRSTPVPQLKCTAGPCQYAPSTAMCRNVGWDGADVQWQCEAELPKGIKLGKVAVSCEGFTHPDDELVLIGSCGLEYELTGTAPVFKSEYKAPKTYFSRVMDWLNSWTLPVAWAYGTHNHHHSHKEYDYYRPHEQSFLSTLITYGAIAVIAYVVYRMMCPTRNVVYVAPNSSYSSSLPFGLSSLLSWFNQPSSFFSSSPAAPGGPHYDAYPKTYSQPHYSQQPSYEAQSSSSFIPNLLSGAAGYWLGSRSAARTAPVEAQHTYATPPVQTVHTQSYAPPAYNPNVRVEREEIRTSPIVNDVDSSRTMSEDKSKTTQTSTAFGTTKRR